MFLISSYLEGNGSQVIPHFYALDWATKYRDMACLTSAATHSCLGMLQSTNSGGFHWLCWISYILNFGMCLELYQLAFTSASSFPEAAIEVAGLVHFLLSFGGRTSLTTIFGEWKFWSNPEDCIT